MSTDNMRENHLCWVAGNTVWSRTTSDLRGFAHYALYKLTYTLLYFRPDQFPDWTTYVKEAFYLVVVVFYVVSNDWLW